MQNISRRHSINVCGSLFYLSKETIEKLETRKSVAAEQLHGAVDHSKEIYFERNDVCFKAILGYLRGRGLHMPLSVCQQEFAEELEFWGIEPTEMSKCCYSRFISYFDDQRVLAILENDQENRLTENRNLQERVGGKGWTSVQAKLWSILEEPSCSIIARIYFYISSVFVIASIFSLVSGTHDLFLRDLTLEEWREFFQDEPHKYEDHFGDNLSLNDTIPPLPKEAKAQKDVIIYIEYISVTYFTIEIVIRLMFCPYKRKFFTSFLNLVDIFAILVMYSKYIVNYVNPREKYEASIFDIVHCLQIVRVFRLFRLVRSFIGFRVLLYALRASSSEMLLMSMFLFVGMLMFSAFVFFSGDKAFASIPDAFWWAIVTMTTVGYGDVYPTLPLSKTVGAFCAVTGVCLLAVIIPIFVNNFLLFYSYSKIWRVQDVKKKSQCAWKNDATITKAFTSTKIEPFSHKYGE